MHDFYKSIKQRYPHFNVSYKTIRRILKDNIIFQSFMTRKKTLLNSHVYSRGMGIECWSDVCYFRYAENNKNKKEMVWLICQDIFTKYCYTTLIEENRVNSANLKRAFLRLFRGQKMPHFSIIR